MFKRLKVFRENGRRGKVKSGGVPVIVSYQKNPNNIYSILTYISNYQCYNDYREKVFALIRV